MTLVGFTDMREQISQRSKSIQTAVVERRPTLRTMLDPKTIALIGATEAPNSFGRTMMENLLSCGRTVYPINLKRTSVLGVKAFPKISDAPAVVDLAIIATQQRLSRNWLLSVRRRV